MKIGSVQSMGQRYSLGCRDGNSLIVKVLYRPAAKEWTIAAFWQHLTFLLCKDVSLCEAFQLVCPSIRLWWHAPKVCQVSLKANREGEERVRDAWKKARQKTAGLEPIRPREASSTCTARPPGWASVTRWGIIIITIIYLLSRGRLWGQLEWDSRIAISVFLVFGPWKMLEEEGRVNARLKPCIHLEASADWCIVQ